MWRKVKKNRQEVLQLFNAIEDATRYAKRIITIFRTTATSVMTQKISPYFMKNPSNTSKNYKYKNILCASVNMYSIARITENCLRCNNLLMIKLLSFSSLSNSYEL